jgi:hypothetical protein
MTAKLTANFANSAGRSQTSADGLMRRFDLGWTAADARGCQKRGLQNRGECVRLARAFYICVAACTGQAIEPSAKADSGSCV